MNGPRANQPPPAQALKQRLQGAGARAGELWGKLKAKALTVGGKSPAAERREAHYLSGDLAPQSRTQGVACDGDSAAPASGVVIQPKLFHVCRPNATASLGCELEEYHVMCVRLKAKGAAEKRGITIEAVWQDSLAQLSGLHSGDTLVGVNNVVWDAKKPKRSYQRLHSELRGGGANLTLLVIPSRR